MVTHFLIKIEKADYSPTTVVVTDFHSYHYNFSDKNAFIRGLALHLGKYAAPDQTIHGTFIVGGKPQNFFATLGSLENCLRRFVKKHGKNI